VGSVTGVLIAVGVVGLLGAGAYFATRRPGWYVGLYNYPVGDPDRRLKGYRGPYPSRDEAVAVGRQEASVWYPKVEYLEGPPF
jgi:hypothetical protein